MSQTARRQADSSANVVRTFPAAMPKCRLCECKLVNGSRDDFAREICAECARRPEARRLGLAAVPPTESFSGARRPFTAADKAMIAKVHAFMPAALLLNLLNERLRADVGAEATPYTMEQLHEELRATQPQQNGSAGSDWASVRRVLGQARKSGALQRVTAQVIEDFAVIFALTPPQLMRLKDVLLNRSARADQGAAR